MLILVECQRPASMGFTHPRVGRLEILGKRNRDTKEKDSVTEYNWKGNPANIGSSHVYFL